MEWVEVRGETLEAAKEEALDQLGVAADDAEFEIVQEPESRWMGLKKTEARVRARVRPTQPRPKREGRNNRGKRRERGGDAKQRDAKGQGRGNNGGRGGQRRGRGEGGRGDNRSKDTRDQGNRGEGGRVDAGGQQDAGTSAEDKDRRNQQSSDGGQKPASAGQRDGRKEKKPVSEQSSEPMPQAEQEAAVLDFLTGLADGFGLDAEAAVAMDDDVMIGSINGPDLGLMVGPKGGTMHAIQELTRAAVQRRSDGRDTARVMVDVAGYRERRRAALAEFAQTQADVVKAEGVELALEPMGSADRKAVHDAIAEIDGVRSISEGDEPRRRVVLLPDD